MSTSMGLYSIKEFKEFLTHAGTFHSDDVIAAALINIITGKENNFEPELDVVPKE